MITDDVPEGYKYSEAQQIVWDWWCMHQNAVPICDDLNDLIWKLDALRRETMTEAELEREAEKLAQERLKIVGQPDIVFSTPCLVTVDDAINLAKKYRG